MAAKIVIFWNRPHGFSGLRGKKLPFARVESSVQPCNKFIFRLEMHILSLRMYILSLKIHILNLRIKKLAG